MSLELLPCGHPPELKQDLRPFDLFGQTMAASGPKELSEPTLLGPDRERLEDSLPKIHSEEKNVLSPKLESVNCPNPPPEPQQPERIPEEDLRLPRGRRRRAMSEADEVCNKKFHAELQRQHTAKDSMETSLCNMSSLLNSVHSEQKKARMDRENQHKESMQIISDYFKKVEDSENKEYEARRQHEAEILKVLKRAQQDLSVLASSALAMADALGAHPEVSQPLHASSAIITAEAALGQRMPSQQHATGGPQSPEPAPTPLALPPSSDDDTDIEASQSIL